ncbi:MAG TPA: hypothetical protein PLA97_11240 [Rubrivivax sp.]|nr:hypothetical protein [Rubrivivax sp.]
MAPACGGAAPEAGPVVINTQPLSPATRSRLEATYRTRLLAGRYWYDPRTGWWGVEGGPTIGLVHAGLALGGPLRADASHGSSGVFINGRQLHGMEVTYLRTLGPVWPGRYWADALGNVGLEGQSLPFANLYALAQQRHGGPPPTQGGSGAFSSEGNCLMYQRRDLSGTSYGASVGC